MDRLNDSDMLRQAQGWYNARDYGRWYDVADFADKARSPEVVRQLRQIMSALYHMEEASCGCI